MSARAQRGSLRRRKSGGVWVWLGTWWEDGHRRAKTLGKTAEMNKTQAQEELDKLVRRVNEQRRAVEYTLQGYARQVVFPWYERSWKPSTTITTTDRIDHHILKELGNKKLTWFTRNNLQDFLDKKASTGLSQATMAHLRWDLRQLFRMAVSDGLLQRNPAELLHTPSGTRQERRVLTISQAQWILTVLGLRERLIVKLAGICGMRPGEIIGLQWADLQPDGLRITRAIYRGIVQTPKSHHSARTVAISTTVREDFDALRAVALNAAPGDWVFPNEKCNKPVWANNLWYDKIRPTLAVAGLGWVNYQVLRRSAVSLLNALGADGTIVAAQCGHTVDVSLNTYNKVGIQRQQAAVQALDNAITTTEKAAA